MITASAPAAQPADWRRSYRDAITDPHELLELLQLPQLRERLAVGDAGFALRVPRGYAARMRVGDPADPLLRQVLPLDLESLVVQGFGLDAVGDLDSRGAPGVLHKYAGRALLIATGSCAINCRYCFRRHFPYAQELAAANAWRDAIEYLAATPQVDEVILSGGDPLSLSTGKLAELTDRMRTLPHIRRLRIHTRLPVVLPERIDPALLEWLGSLPWPVVMVIHANHANEIDSSVETALGSLRRHGVRLLNQSVLLRGVNDAVDALVRLSERLFDVAVQPYYLHLLDRVAGTAHFEVDEALARALVAEVRARLPGYLVPTLVREIAGDRSKQPI